MDKELKRKTFKNVKSFLLEAAACGCKNKINIEFDFDRNEIIYWFEGYYNGNCIFEYKIKDSLFTK